LVNNALKYANASSIFVQLVQDDGCILLTVKDNGCGFDTEKVAQTGMGLENIRARVAACKGKLNIYSSPGKGTEINVELKIEMI
jgi:signal transduction histidine kinase